jgi:hypothetical protein
MPRLRHILLADAGACFMAGGAVLATSDALAAGLTRSGVLFGSDAGTLLRALGVGVLAVGAWVLALAQRPDGPSRGAVVPILILEAVWIVSCVLLLLLAAADLSILGVAFVLAAALMVGVFLTLEAAALLDLQPPTEKSANGLQIPGPAAAVRR